MWRQREVRLRVVGKVGLGIEAPGQVNAIGLVDDVVALAHVAVEPASTRQQPTISPKNCSVPRGRGRAVSEAKTRLMSTQEVQKKSKFLNGAPYAKHVLGASGGHGHSNFSQNEAVRARPSPYQGHKEAASPQVWQGGPCDNNKPRFINLQASWQGTGASGCSSGQGGVPPPAAVAEVRANCLALPLGPVILLDYPCSMSQLQGETRIDLRAVCSHRYHSTNPLHAMLLFCTDDLLACISTSTSGLSPCMAVQWPHGEGASPGPNQATAGR